MRNLWIHQGALGARSSSLCRMHLNVLGSIAGWCTVDDDRLLFSAHDALILIPLKFKKEIWVFLCTCSSAALDRVRSTIQRTLSVAWASAFESPACCTSAQKHVLYCSQTAARTVEAAR
eukprot:1149664-Pelagomonas_calceolata.AAC.3